MTILSGIKIIEIEAIGPAPFCGMQLADLGADVILIERPVTPSSSAEPDEDTSILNRGKRKICLNLKDANDVDQVKQLICSADGLIEGMRPGVMEKLGLGPDVCLQENPKLAYGRVTGWGQSGPLSHAAGHDINYIALSSALWYSGQPGEPPVAPPTLIGDIGGGALHLSIGMLAALLKAQRTGQGDVIDAAMIDGSANMMNLLFSARAAGRFEDQRGINMLDGPHWYDSYRCSDNNFITIGSLEPKFYALLLERLELSDNPDFAAQFDIQKWPAQKQQLTELFQLQPRSYWCDLLEGTDVCFAPVLSPDEAVEHPQMKARDIFNHRNGNLQANPAPRFTNTPHRIPENAHRTTTQDILKEWQSN